MREGIVLFLDEDEVKKSADDSMALYVKSDVYRADLVICGDKVIKNRWGKYGTIITESEHPVDYNLRMRLLLDIWNEITKQKGVKV